MPQAAARLKDILLSFFTKSLPSLVLSLSLFLGGIALLALRIPGWSLILGLPAVQVGIIFLIFTFDEITRKKVGPESYHMISCSVCGKPTLAPKGVEEKICRACQSKVAKKLNLKKH